MKTSWSVAPHHATRPPSLSLSRSGETTRCLTAERQRLLRRRKRSRRRDGRGVPRIVDHLQLLGDVQPRRGFRIVGIRAIPDDVLISQPRTITMSRHLDHARPINPHALTAPNRPGRLARQPTIISAEIRTPSAARSIQHRARSTRVHPATLCLWRSKPPGGGARLCVFCLSGLSGR